MSIGIGLLPAVCWLCQAPFGPSDDIVTHCALLNEGAYEKSPAVVVEVAHRVCHESVPATAKAGALRKDAPQ